MSKLLTIIILIFFCAYSNAQNVKYYQLIRKEKNGVSDKDVKGGLFITFVSNMCYESDNDGVGINHGTMKRNDGYSNSQVTIYDGSSYWGKNTAFKFNSDKSGLNVIFDDGEIFIYKNATPPKGVTSSSNIRIKEKTGSSSIGVPSYTPAPQNYTNPIGVGGVDSRQDKQVREKIIHETCRRCAGKKRIVYNTYPPMFGLDDHEVRCNECGEYHLRSVGHSHIDCPDCGGRGYKERINYTYE